MSSTAKILLVGDVGTVDNAAALALTQASYEVAHAASGDAALALAKQFQPDLVVLHAPISGPSSTGSGVALLRLFKADPQLSMCAVILLDAHNSSEEAEAAALDAGADDYIAGPVSPRALLARVRLHLRHHEARRALRDGALFAVAERPRDETEDRFHLLWEASPDAIILIDQHNIIRYANPALLKVFGHTPAFAVGKNLALLQPAHLVAGHAHGMQRHLETGQRTIDWRAVQTTGLHKDGHQFPVEVAFSGMEINGEPMFAGFIRDITDRKQAEAAQTWLLQILDLSLDEIYVFDVETLRFDSVNQGALRNLGYSREAMRQMTPLDLKPEFTETAFRQFVTPLLQREKDQLVFETVHRRADGSLYPVEVRLQLIEQKDNRAFLGVVMDITVRKDAEIARHKSEDRLQFVMASAGVGYWDMDIAANITQRSVWHDRCFGYDDLLPHWGYDTFLAHVHPDDRERVDARYAAARAGRGNYNVEFRVIWPDASTHWLQSIGRFTVDVAGVATRVSGVIINVTDRKLAAEAAEKNASLLRVASKAAQFGGWAFNLSEKKLTWSNEIFEMLGYPPTALVGPEMLVKVYTPESYDRRMAAVAACAVHGTTFDLELQAVTQRGSKLWVRQVGQAVTDAAGAVIAVHGAVQDISARRAADQQMRLLQTAVSRLNDIVLITEAEPIDAPGPRIVFVNDAFERRTGYNREEVLGKSPKFLQGPRTQRAELDRIRRALERWEPIRAELINYTKAGDEFWIELDIVPLSDESGWYTHWVAIERDITERRSLEERLRQSQRMEAVGQLTGGVAHDFNNLLTIILGNAELISDLSVDDKRQRTLADMIVSAAQRGAELTQGLLAVARRQPLDPKVLDVNLMLGSMEPLLRRTLGEHVEIEVVRAAGLWPTLVDPPQIESALLNLCINARDAMPTGGKLTIESSNVMIDSAYAALKGDVVPGPYALLAVSDTGAGIAPENLRRVFEPFFTTKEKGKGTGLGLAMVYGFIKQSGGHININSEPGQGTTVKLYLPRAGDDEALSTPTGYEPDTLGGTETILLVEDDAMVRQFAEGQLAALGYTVVVAENGRQALETIKQRSDIDLLFTDVVMPGGMSGRQLADEAVIVRPGLKVLYTSGYTENAIVHHGRLDPGVLLLSKPYRRAELARKVREALAKREIR